MNNDPSPDNYDHDGLSNDQRLAKDPEYMEYLDTRRTEVIDAQEFETMVQIVADRLAVVAWLEDTLISLPPCVSELELVGYDDNDPNTYVLATLRDGSNYPEGNGFPPDGQNPELDAVWDTLVDLQEGHRKALQTYALGLPRGESLIVHF